jgi:DtxR family Mn-dependent transcriptional regulator
MTSVALLGVVSLLLLLVTVRWRVQQRSVRSRQHLEDALKHMFDEEYRGRHASIHSVSGVLRQPARVVIDLVGRMQAQGLVTARGSEFDLTPDGERFALQVVRAHRLLERYFADEARLPLGRVHAAAERREHSLSQAQIERLAASLGHPAFDPHGDPIPSREGAVPPASGTPVTSWPPDTRGRIVHLEDEPQISFAQILAEGLRIGQVVRIVEATPARVVLTDGENEFRLAPAVAANVFVVAAPSDADQTGVVRLSDMDDHESAQVVGLDPSCQGFSRRRLMDLGFTEGAEIRPVLRTFAGDPRAYRVRGTVVALRRDQASQVLVRRAESRTQGVA